MFFPCILLYVLLLCVMLLCVATVCVCYVCFAMFSIVSVSTKAHKLSICVAAMQNTLCVVVVCVATMFSVVCLNKTSVVYHVCYFCEYDLKR